MAKNKGGAFEDLTENIFRKLTDPKIHKIERNVKIEGPDGKREIDILITYLTNNIEHKTIIECKDYKRPLTIEKLDAIASKMKDVKANKAIMVTRSGYSKQSKSKAKRLNIDLFTAHQASSEKWGIDIDIPIRVTEVTPKTTLKLSIKKNNPASSYKSSFTHDNFEVNNVNILKLFIEKWNNQEINYSPEKSTQLIDFPGIEPPYLIKDTIGELIELDVFKVELKLEITYYLGNIKEYEGIQLLKNSLNEHKYLLMNDFPLKRYRKILSKVEKKDLPEYDTLAFNLINSATYTDFLSISSIEGYNN